MQEKKKNKATTTITTPITTGHHNHQHDNQPSQPQQQLTATTTTINHETHSQNPQNPLPKSSTTTTLAKINHYHRSHQTHMNTQKNPITAKRKERWTVAAACGLGPGSERRGSMAARWVRSTNRGRWVIGDVGLWWLGRWGQSGSVGTMRVCGSVRPMWAVCGGEGRVFGVLKIVI